MLFAASIMVPLCPRPFPSAMLGNISTRAGPLAIGFSMHGEECFDEKRRLQTGTKLVLNLFQGQVLYRLGKVNLRFNVFKA